MAKFLKNLFDKKPKVHKVDVARRFELMARVGQGSMSKVWRARDSMTGQMFAVKVLDKVKTYRFESRFLGLHKPSEGEIATSLQHRNIVKTLEYGTTLDDEQYLVMEFVEGVGLSYLVDVQNEQLKEHRLSYLLQLGEAISYLHLQNWIHRDLCPRNVMIDTDNVVKLIDFGLVVPNTPNFQKPGNRTGTANYMAPELIKRQKTDQRIDIFSFAVTAYEVYTKRLPWDVAASETMDTVLQHINKPPAPIEEFVPDIDSRVAKIIMKGLRQNPNDRWQTMAELLLPMRKAHEDIEARRSLERKKSAAKAKNTNKAAAAKQAQDDDFFEQLLLGESRVQGKSSPSTAKPPALPKPRTSDLKPPPAKPVPQEEPDIIVEDEFDGIEVEESDDDFAGIEIEEEGIEVENDGIEIEVERDMAAEPPAPSGSSGRKLAALLDSDASRLSPTKAPVEDDDEPVLRLPDDDDDVPSRPTQNTTSGK